jgi:protein ImuB
MSRSLQVPDLFARESADPPHREPTRGPRARQLWISICLPNLAFECFSRVSPDRPAVVVEPHSGRLDVIACNAAASAAGIAVGQPLNAAQARAATLDVLERKPQLELVTLESLASFAYALSPAIDIALPDSVLLEVAGSLKLFHDLVSIKSKLGSELSRRGLTANVCVAPTALAATWLARGGEVDVSKTDELAVRVGRLPLHVTLWSEETRALLRDLGVRSLADCLRLPRAGFARRVGRRHLQDLDRALGRADDVRAEFAPPQRWRMAVELFGETADRGILIEAIETILDRLVVDLRTRQMQVQSLQLAFAHVRHPRTYEKFELVEPTHEHGRLLDLVRDRVERIVLPVPAIGVSLRTGLLQPMMLRAAGLFEPTAVESSTHQLVERLRGRFGSTAVFGLGLAAEHRPENAWTKLVDAPIARADPTLPSNHGCDRPLWLLPQPLPLADEAARSYYRGTLELSTGPERIETGWWDDHDIARDYYVAVSSHGQKLWIYRDRVMRDWHLHGLFG